MMKTAKNYLFLLGSLVWLFAACSQENQPLESTQLQRQGEQPVNVQVALSAASSFDRLQNNTSKPTLRKAAKTVNETLTVLDASTQPAFYVINYASNRGWVIVSAERKIQPILAFSDQGTFSLDNLNPGVQGWINDLKRAIAIYRTDEKAQAQPGAERAWQKYTATNTGPVTNGLPGDDPPVSCNWTKTVPDLLSTHWGQGSGYNGACPVASGGPCGYAVTGCVATAMAQVMRYHNYPTYYNWSSMPSQASGSCGLSTGEGELAFLMHQVGMSVSMSYGASSSGANPMNVEGALENTFGYSSLTERFVFDWQGAVNELDASRPIILDGGTHMWVCSGYQRTDIDCSWQYLYLWMNWGWNGDSRDGYYAYNNWAPSGYDFNSGKAMTFVHRP